MISITLTFHECLHILIAEFFLCKKMHIVLHRLIQFFLKYPTIKCYWNWLTDWLTDAEEVARFLSTLREDKAELITLLWVCVWVKLGVCNTIPCVTFMIHMLLKNDPLILAPYVSPKIAPKKDSQTPYCKLNTQHSWN